MLNELIWNNMIITENINDNKSVSKTLYPKTDKEFYHDKYEAAAFLKTMLKKYLLTTGQWGNDWYRIVGEEFHSKDWEWRDDYTKYDADLFEIFIIKNDNKTFVKHIVLFSDFLEWNDKRKNSETKTC